MRNRNIEIHKHRNIEVSKQSGSGVLLLNMRNRYTSNLCILPSDNDNVDLKGSPG